jgi:hypothetical protein
MAGLWLHLVTGTAALAGQDAPRSLLPPGFDPPPAAAPAAPAPLLPGAPPQPAPEPDAQPGQPPLLPPEAGEDTPAPPPDPFANRLSPPGAPIGLFNPRPGDLTAFAGSNGRLLAGLAARIARPIASRWAMINLRVALLARVPGPPGINDGDWVAARSGLLLRLGEADGARRLIDALTVERFTPATYRIAAPVSLAAADLAGLCPIAATGRALSPSPLWDLAFAMCAGMEGDDITAASLIDALRNQGNRQSGRVEPFDVRLAARVAVLAGGAGRAEGINWQEVEGISLFRYGVASAAGVMVPAERLAGLGPAHAGWAVRNANLPAPTRLPLLRRAAALGSISAAELASGVAALSPADAGGGFADNSRAGRLREAFTAGSPAARAAALAAIRSDVAAGEDPYGALLETATAARAVRPAAALADAAPDIIAALLAMGDARAALAWWPAVREGDAAARLNSWALLAAGSGGVPISVSDFKDWQGQARPRATAMLLASLSGLGQAQGNDWNRLKRDLIPAVNNRWTAAIRAAGQRRAGGEVALLAATGLQGAGWADVPPAHVEAIVAALVAAGRVAEARRIAAEAVTRTR